MHITSRTATFLLFLLLAASILYPAIKAEGSDKENCLMCHKYRQIGRIDEMGRKISYYVSEDIYANTVHRNVPCRDCHTYIDRIPHEPVNEQVDCANKCHVRPPFSKENFSHKRIVETYNASVHGIRKDDPDTVRQAKPYCKYCHLNPVFSRIDEKKISFDKTLARCLNCHEKKGVTQAYKHITHRLRHKTSRPPGEIVSLCADDCHGDRKLMRSLDVSEESLDAVSTYNESIHGKAVRLGSLVAADCISCHASSAIHDIYKKDNPAATVNKANLVQTCSQCHEKVSANYTSINVHNTLESGKDPVLRMLAKGLTLVFYGSVFGLIGLALIETWGRKRDGIRWQLKNGTTWRRKQ